MRRALWGSVLVAVLAAAGAAIAFVWLPAVGKQHDREWMKAGHRAVAAVRLPGQFREFRQLTTGTSTQICGSVRCYVTSGDPRDNVADVRAALTAVAYGPVTGGCLPDGGFASAPDRCRFVVPVDGSRLGVWIVARFNPVRVPVDAHDFDGTIVQLFVQPRG